MGTADRHQLPAAVFSNIFVTPLLHIHGNTLQFSSNLPVHEKRQPILRAALEIIYLTLGSASEVVALFEIRDQRGVNRPPSQAFLSECARRRIIC
jgi:hypothetical protein